MKKNPPIDEFMEAIDESDFYIVFINDKRVGCGCYRTKAGLRAALEKESGSGNKVDVLTCDWDD